ncbi:acyl-CoA dehydrogenase NM domain-like protein [Teratosphaeria nubilosa]|uniref:Acyl-CoA dehydrogenase NM domain-like protein n=1 Tax=Teratosphaeria nubilosa TaxID=161662 RepID=A0A6G1L2N1_9PEZI|nr:acyl-CoA dehydrogenase NM domain-like protein [Teratosphaeria nubilosa]
MSVPYKIEASQELLLGNTGSSGQPTASQKIPIIARDHVSEKAKKALDLVEKFVEEECIPADPICAQQIGQGVQQRFSAHPPILEDLKKKARDLGLWNLFLPRNHFKEGAGFSNLEYGLMAEYLGKSHVASEACNCSAPDTGNMEVLAKYGTQEQKDRWLKPLLDGKIRSAFLMTEPDVASSDATNIGLSITREGGEYVLNGSKWWSSGAGDPRCEVYIVMGKTDPKNPSPYRQQSVLFVPYDTPGITIKRMLSVYGFDDAPHGHGHILFENVRVPVSNICLGEGRGFEVIQGRLGPGRIHHAMRSIGAAEKALEYFLARINDPKKKPFGKMLHEHGIMLERVARSRIEIDAARLTVLNAALMIDTKDAKFALKEIAEAKVLVPQVMLDVVDRAVQAYGGAGVSQDTPLANMWAHGRTMRIVDGPDEVHLLQLGRNENKRGQWLLKKIEWQTQRSDEIARRFGASKRDVLQLDRRVSEEKAKAKL